MEFGDRPKHGRWPLWLAALIGIGAGIAYGAVKFLSGTAPPPPPDSHPDAYAFFLAGQWAGFATIFALFFVIVALARNYIVRRSAK